MYPFINFVTLKTHYIYLYITKNQASVALNITVFILFVSFYISF